MNLHLILPTTADRLAAEPRPDPGFAPLIAANARRAAARERVIAQCASDLLDACGHHLGDAKEALDAADHRHATGLDDAPERDGEREDPDQ